MSCTRVTLFENGKKIKAETVYYINSHVQVKILWMAIKNINPRQILFSLVHS